MPRFGGGGEKCPSCNKTVYANEAFAALGKKWHRACFRCTACSKTLNVTNAEEYEALPYCKKCYRAVANVAGAADARAAELAAKKDEPLPDSVATGPMENLTATATAATTPVVVGAVPLANRTPRGTCAGCSKRVYANEKMVILEQDWHRTGCFRCVGCNKALAQTSYESHNGVPHCKRCYAIASNTAAPADPLATRRRQEMAASSGATTATPVLATAVSSPARATPGADVAPKAPRGTCGGCNKRVYANEKVSALGQDWHALCIKCRECSKALQATAIHAVNGYPYCDRCGTEAERAPASADDQADAVATTATPAEAVAADDEAADAQAAAEADAALAKAEADQAAAAAAAAAEQERQAAAAAEAEAAATLAATKAEADQAPAASGEEAALAAIMPRLMASLTDIEARLERVERSRAARHAAGSGSGGVDLSSAQQRLLAVEDRLNRVLASRGA